MIQPKRVAGLCLTYLLWVAFVPLPADAAVIRGRVESPQSLALGRVTVTVELMGAAGEDPFSASEQTDEQGRYVFENVPDGMFGLSAQKQGWLDAETVVSSTRPGVPERSGDVIVMELTPLYLLLTNLQFGGTLYVVLFGLLILIFNFYWVPEPSKGVAIAGWLVLALGIGVANYRTGLRVGLPMGLIGGAAAIAIHKLGHKTASRRLAEEQQEIQQQHDRDEWERERLWTLVGKAGTAVSDLKAHGTVQIGDAVLQARALRGYIPRDSRVVVTKIEGLTPIVEQPHSDTLAG